MMLWRPSGWRNTNNNKGVLRRPTSSKVMIWCIHRFGVHGVGALLGLRGVSILMLPVPGFDFNGTPAWVETAVVLV